MQFFMHRVQRVAVFHPFGFNRRKEIPDLAGTFLYGQRTEAQLKAV
jgi:hypothetical protein